MFEEVSLPGASVDSLKSHFRGPRPIQALSMSTVVFSSTSSSLLSCSDKRGAAFPLPAMSSRAEKVDPSGPLQTRWSHLVPSPRVGRGANHTLNSFTSNPSLFDLFQPCLHYPISRTNGQTRRSDNSTEKQNTGVDRADLDAAHMPGQSPLDLTTERPLHHGFEVAFD